MQDEVPEVEAGKTDVVHVSMESKKTSKGIQSSESDQEMEHEESQDERQVDFSFLYASQLACSRSRRATHSLPPLLL